MAYVFVLWSDGFDEKVAAIFVAELRDVGLLVKVVGLTTQHTSGARGLILVPDLTLDQALSLASQTLCLIIPSKSRWNRRLNDDPRVRQFIERAKANQAIFVARLQNTLFQTDLILITLAEKNVIEYPDDENIITFARELAELLLQKAV